MDQWSQLLTPEVLRQGRLKGKFTKVINKDLTVKAGTSVTRAQYDLLTSIHATRSIPCPEPIAFVEVDGCNAIIMSTVPGRNLGEKFFSLSETEIIGIARNLVSGLNALDRAMSTQGATSLVSIGMAGCLCLPHSDKFTNGPVEISSFIETMIKENWEPDDLLNTERELLDYLIVNDGLAFCHMDLHNGNIMVHQGKFSGLVDWDWAGWYTSRMQRLTATYGRLPDDVAFAQQLFREWGHEDEFEFVLKSMDILTGTFDHRPRTPISIASVLLHRPPHIASKVPPKKSVRSDTMASEAASVVPLQASAGV